MDACQLYAELTEVIPPLHQYPLIYWKPNLVTVVLPNNRREVVVP